MNSDEGNWEHNSSFGGVSINTDMKVFHGVINGNEDVLSILNKPPLVQTKKTSNSTSKIYQVLNYKPRLDQLTNEKKETNENNELLSFRNRNDINSEEYKKKYSKKNNNKKEQLLLKFKDITEEDEEVLQGGFNPPSPVKDEGETTIQFIKTNNKSKFTFRVAGIEKGVALLVTKEDCIFTMPVILLPFGIKIGNSYSFMIEETNNVQQSQKKIVQLQREYLKDYL